MTQPMPFIHVLQPIAYSIEDAARACGVSSATVRRAIAARDLVPRYLTSRGVLLRTELEEWVEAAPQERR